MRAIRDSRYKFILNLSPDQPYSYPLSYAEQITTNPVMRRLHQEGKLTGEAAEWFLPTKPREEFYDTQTDPHEINNLIDDPKYQKIIRRMRVRLQQWRKEIRDLGDTPERAIQERMWPGG
ncbi:MAG: DUF4976 domain-containing protein, partial [Bacteroidia bacterium]|nr:DUF4976 domain-containing protein [Bacteroidia bacterium]